MKAIFVFFFALSVYLIDYKVFLIGNDATPNINLPVSIFKYGELTVDAYKFPELFNWGFHINSQWTPINIRVVSILMDMYPEYFLGGLIRPEINTYSFIKTQNNHKFANIFGIGSSLAAVPFYAALATYNYKLLNSKKVLWFTGKITAASYIALSVMLVFLILSLFTSSNIALFISFFYAFGTCVYSVASQTLWQQSPSIFFLILSVYFFLKSELSKSENDMRKTQYFTLFCALSVGFAMLCRPTNFMLLPLLGLSFLALGNFKRIPLFIIGLTPFLLLQMYYNDSAFGSPFYFAQTEAASEIAKSKTGFREVWQWNFLESLPAMLFSPSRGLFVFSPLFLLCFLGIWEILKKEKWRLFRYLLPLPLAFLLIQASWFDWWGGWTYGYRTLLETCPFLCLFLAPSIEQISSKLAKTMIGFLCIWSLVIQLLGVYCYNNEWNSMDCDIDKASCRFRLWSLENNVIVYYAKNINKSREIKKSGVADWLR